MSIVDSTAAVSELVDKLLDLPTSPPSLYVDVEGINLSRNGTISIVQIYSLPEKQTYLLDVYTLQKAAFTTSGKTGTTIQDILEAQSIPKVFYDVRNDSDALYANFSIHLRGIQDLQLMELATRSFARRYVTGLSKCIVKDAPLSYAQQTEWLHTKEIGTRLFAPEKGGSYEVFNQRPLPDTLVAYCTNDVRFLPLLWKKYNDKMGRSWRQKVLDESTARVKLSHSRDFNGKGQHMAVAPAGW